MRTRLLALLLPSCLAPGLLACFEDVGPPIGGETSGDGDGDGDPGDGDGDGAPGDGDGTPGDGDGTPGDGDGDGAPGDGDGTPGDGDGDGDPGPMCTPSETDCGGVCVNLEDDPQHCGGCGHGCLGGTCSAATCEPIELASGKGRLFMALVDQDHLYYGGDGVAVGRIDKNGNNDTVLVPAGMTVDAREWCYDSAITTDAIVWGNDWVQPGVRGCTTPNCVGGVQTFMPGMNLLAIDFDADNSRLYWTQGANIVSAAWPNGVTSTFATTDSPVELDSDGSYLYWVSRVAMADYHIRKRAVGGGAVTELAINRPSAGAMAVAANKIIWAENAAIVEAALPNGIGGAQPAMFANVGSVRQIVIDDTHVYWTSNQDGVGTVGRCPISGCGGPPEILAQVPQPWGITFDPAAVYFVTETGRIYKVAK